MADPIQTITKLDPKAKSQSRRVVMLSRSSPAFVGAPEGNGCVERAIRTLKEQLLRVRGYETVEKLMHRIAATGRDLQQTAAYRARRLQAARATPARALRGI